MLLRITDKCSMQCTHCLGDYTPTGEHMSKQTFIDAIDFIIKTNPIIHIAVSGGEPTEHPQFIEFMEMIKNKLENTTPSIPKLVTITTNGFWCIEHPVEAQRISNTPPSSNVSIVWQVSTDKRYYPKPLDINHPLWSNPSFTLCNDCVLQIYPQGRALTNHIPYQSKAPKCFNLRSIMKNAVSPSPSISKLQMATLALLQKGYSCTPSIGIHGEICLGESRLCPPAASIYDSIQEVDNKIIQFRCHKCEFLLSPEHIKYINS